MAASMVEGESTHLTLLAAAPRSRLKKAWISPLHVADEHQHLHLNTLLSPAIHVPTAAAGTVARAPQLPSLIKCRQVRSSIYRILLTDLYQTLYMLPEANGNHSLVKTTTKQHKSRSKDEGDRRIEGYLLNPSEKSYLAPWPEIDSSIQPSLSLSFPLVKPRHTSPMAESPRT
jgi:hypothetical protein